MEKKERKNDQPVWVDLVKQFLDEQGRETFLKVFDYVLPQSVRDWFLEDAKRRMAIGGALSAASIGAARIIPNTAWGEVTEELIREVVATFKDFIGGDGQTEKTSSGPKQSPTSPAVVEKKAAIAAAAVRLGMGDLPAPARDSLGKLIQTVQVRLGQEASHEAILLLDAMSYKDQLGFAGLDLEAQIAEIQARTWKKPEAAKPAPAKKGLSLWERMNINVSASIHDARRGAQESVYMMTDAIEEARDSRPALEAELFSAWTKVRMARKKIAEQHAKVKKPLKFKNHWWQFWRTKKQEEMEVGDNDIVSSDVILLNRPKTAY